MGIILSGFFDLSRWHHADHTLNNAGRLVLLRCILSKLLLSV
jgi:hypothetical protein